MKNSLSSIGSYYDNFLELLIAPKNVEKFMFEVGHCVKISVFVVLTFSL